MKTTLDEVRSRTRGWVRAEGVLWRESVDGLLVLQPGSDEVILLEGSASLLWTVLEEPVELEEAAETLAHVHATGVETIAEDLKTILYELFDLEIVRYVR